MKNRTDITIILDRSGSMESVKADTIGGFNSFVAEQQKVEGEASISLVQFDDQYEAVYADKDINSVGKLTEETFKPRGMTALYDAVGRTINSVGQRLAELDESERPDKVVFVILTDGFENASKEFSANKVNDMISHQQEVYSWDFIFIGANQDAVLSAKAIGISANSALTYAANAEGTEEAFGSIANKVSAYRRTNAKMALSFDDEDRAKQEKAMKSKKSKK